MIFNSYVQRDEWKEFLEAGEVYSESHDFPFPEQVAILRRNMVYIGFSN